MRRQPAGGRLTALLLPLPVLAAYGASVAPSKARIGALPDSATGAAMGIVVGSVVDGVPESLSFGVQLATGLPVSASFLAAVWCRTSPRPSPHRPTWRPQAGACGVSGGSGCWSWSPATLAAALGFLLAEHSSAVTGEGIAAFTAGGLLAMLTNSLIPFAYEHGGELAGLGTVLGFCLSLISS